MGKIDHSPRPVSVGTFKSTSLTHYLVNRVLDTGRISYGPMSQEFEDKFSLLHGCEYAILSNSGTSALQIALQAMKEVHNWKDGDEVIVPATTFVATANIVQHNNLTPVFVDVSKITYNMGMHHVQSAVTSRTRAIIPVHLFGQPADIKELKLILKLLGREDIKIIEDSCECMFATHHSEPVGSLGDIGCFSTYVAHLIVTGVGGISTTNSSKYAAKMRSLVNHGLELEFLNVDNCFRPQPMPGRRFKFSSVGHSYRITELEAALGIAQLHDHEKMIAIRRRNAHHLTAGLCIVNQYYNKPLRLPMTLPYNTHSWMMYAIVLSKRKDGTLVSKEPLMKWLNDHQIETRDMLPLIDQPIYDYLSGKGWSYPISHWLVESGFYVGCHQDLSPEDIQYTVQVIEDYFDKHEGGHQK